jgi:hypothetical protein
MKYVAKKSIDTNHAVSTLKLENIPEFDKIDYDLTEPNQYDKFIKDIEYVCRNSFEYRQIIEFLKKYKGFHRCAIFQNVSCLENRKIKIHVHHEPFTLYDISETVYNKRLASGQNCEVEMIAMEVTYLHYIGLVGLIPLSETPHELVHNQFYQIPMSSVRGNYEEFLRIYGAYVPDSAMERYIMKKSYDAMYLAHSAPHNNILDTDYLYVEHELNKVSSYDNLLETLEERKLITQNSMYGQLMNTCPIIRIKKEDDNK